MAASEGDKAVAAAVLAATFSIRAGNKAAKVKAEIADAIRPHVEAGGRGESSGFGTEKLLAAMTSEIYMDAKRVADAMKRAGFEPPRA